MKEKFVKKQYARDLLVITGDSVLSTLTAPVMKLVGDGSSGSIGVGLALSVLAWPITLPCAVVFGTAWSAYNKRLDVEAARQRVGEINLTPDE